MAYPHSSSVESASVADTSFTPEQARAAQQLSLFIQYNFQAMDRNNNDLIEKEDLDAMLTSSWAEIPSYQTVREKQSMLSQLARNDGDGGISMLDAKVLNNAFNNTSDTEPFEREKTDFLSTARFGLLGLAREYQLIGLEQFKTAMPDNYYAVKRQMVLANDLFGEIKLNQDNQRMGVEPTYRHRAFVTLYGLVKKEEVKE
jgi:hypothetical protein